MCSSTYSLKASGTLAAVALLSVQLLSACTSTTTMEEKKPPTTVKQSQTLAVGKQTMESIGDSSYKNNTLTFEAISHGCTRSEHFSLTYAINGNRCEVTVVRNAPDHCRMAPHVGEYTIKWPQPENCAGMPVVVVNPKL